MALTKTSKKRPATSQDGRPAKKVQLSKPADKSKRRNHPVTIATPDDSEAESGADSLDGDEPNEEIPIDVPSVKDPNAISSRESHKAQRTLLSQRRAVKPHSDLLTDAKRIWKLAHRKNATDAERRKHIKDLMGIIRGKVKDIVLKHDASRIIQTVVKHGNQQERDEIAGELKGSYRDLVQHRYSKFLVSKLIRQCPNHRASILLEFQGHVIRLLLHREASRVIADAYELYGNAYERSILVRDFYGKEAALFSLTSGSDADKERSKKGLKGVLEGAQEESRKRILVSLKENLVTIFNNPDKGAVTHAIVHHALWEYLVEVNETTDETERQKLFKEIFESCQDVLAEMVHTKDGSHVVRDFIARGTAKDRKHIIKAVKPHIERMCKDDEAQLVLFTAMDCVDDTKLLSKSLISDITSKAPILYQTPQGRRSLFYLLVPRTRRHFTPAQIVLLAETDKIKTQTSKKDDDVRREEVRNAASESLIEWLQKSGGEVVRDPGGSLVATEVMLYAEGDKSAVAETLLKPLSTPYPSASPDKPHPIDLPHASRFYKALLQGGHFDHSTSTVSRSPHFSPASFASSFVKIVGKDATLAMAKGNGAFIVAELLERVRQEEEGTEELKAQVKEWFGGGVKAEIERAEMKGKKVLLEKIEELS